MILNKLPPDVAELTCLPAVWHNHLEKIVLRVMAKDKAIRKAGFMPVVIYGDCGTGGQPDVLLDQENVARIPGSHCYQSFLVEAEFNASFDQELGTFSLTY